MQPEPEILPGAALNDPGLRNTILEKYHQALEKGVDGLWSLDRKIDVAIAHILASYPWREYEFKRGYWFHGTTAETYSLINRWRKSDSGIQLRKPNTGGIAGELSCGMATQQHFPEQRGRLWFAGDPRIAGVFTHAGDGKRVITYGSSMLTIAPFENIIKMRRGRALNFPVRPLIPSWGHPDILWVADHPEKPKRSERPRTKGKEAARKKLREHDIQYCQQNPWTHADEPGWYVTRAPE